jgi:hypothetical protein
VVKRLPWLEVLDNHKVTEEEVARAKKLRPLDAQVNITSDILGSAQLTVADNTLAAETVGVDSVKFIDGMDETSDRMASTRMVSGDGRSERQLALANWLKTMKQRVKEKRICLKLHYMEMDPRNEESLRDVEIIEVLHMYSLWPEGGVLPWVANSSFTDLQTDLLKRYEVQAPTRSSAGRDAHFVDGHIFVDYVKLCREMEPVAGGRDMDERFVIYC